MYYHRMWGQLSTACSNLLKYPNGELLVAVDHNQLRTIASAVVDPIEWSHPPPSWAVSPWSPRAIIARGDLYRDNIFISWQYISWRFISWQYRFILLYRDNNINRCSLSSTGDRSCNFSMRGNHLAYVATQGKSTILLDLLSDFGK